MNSECKKCLQKEFSDTEYHRAISEYVEQIPEELRTPEKSYQYRLLQCGKCRYLINGICRMCGCFVEIRAAVDGNRCPDKPENWSGEY